MSWKPHILTRLTNAWRNRTEPENMRTVASIYWLTLLVVGIVAAVAIIALALQELGAVVGAQNAPVPAQVGSGPVLDRGALDTMLGQYANRQTQYGSIASSSPVVIPDPAK